MSDVIETLRDSTNGVIARAGIDGLLADSISAGDIVLIRKRIVVGSPKNAKSIDEKIIKEPINGFI